MTLAKVPRLWEIGGGTGVNTRLGYKKAPVPDIRNGGCALLLLDLNQQPFD